MEKIEIEFEMNDLFEVVDKSDFIEYAKANSDYYNERYGPEGLTIIEFLYQFPQILFKFEFSYKKLNMIGASLG
jgi:hypothetical protein